MTIEWQLDHFTFYSDLNLISKDLNLQYEYLQNNSYFESKNKINKFTRDLFPYNCHNINLNEVGRKMIFE